MTEVKHSVFLSLDTAKKDTQYSIDDFLYVCSDCYPSYAVDYMMSSMTFPKDGPEDAIVIDGMSGAIGRINLSGKRVGSLEYKSNAYFVKQITRMRSIWQLEDNAYILRIYHADIINVDGCIKPENKSFVDHFVFIKDVSYSVKGGMPNVMDISMGLIQRNPNPGFNDSPFKLLKKVE